MNIEGGHVINARFPHASGARRALGVRRLALVEDIVQAGGMGSF
jgi:hypothetical protein